MSFNTANPNYISYRMANSELVKITVRQEEKIGNPVEAILGEGSADGMFLLENGQDGSIGKVTAGTFIGEDNGPGRRTGLEAFTELTNVNILAVPGITMRR